MTEKEEKTTLERAELAVQTPIPERRRRRFWLLWWIWAVFGAAVSFRGTLSGSWIAIAAILTAPFWVMFVLWPFFALRDRLRAKRLWAAEVLVLLAPETRGSDEEKTALPVVVGRDGGVLVPLEAWECAFPTIRPEMIPAEVVGAGTHAGVNLPVLREEDLLASGLWSEGEKTPEGASASDFESSGLWVERLRLAKRS